MTGCLGGYMGGNGGLSEVIAAETEVHADGEGGAMVKLCDVAFFHQGVSNDRLRKRKSEIVRL